MTVSRARLLLLALVVLVPSLAVADDGLVGKTTVMPGTVYLERTARGTSLTFELGFSVLKPCRPVVVTFKYLDADGEPLLYRRLVRHQLDALASFVSVFDRQNKVRLHSTQLSPGDFCFVSHPYSETPWADKVPASVECVAYLVGTAGKTGGTARWNVKVNEYKPRTTFRLPVQGTWWHLEGHDAFSHHRQIFSPQNTNYFACDLVRVNENLELPGSTLEECLSYGEPILAAARGRVAKVQDGIPDNPPGRRAEGFDAQKPETAGGNIVLLDHGNDEFSYYAHLQPDSLKVKVGQLVQAGDVLGLCGNSGNSDTPHLHFHVVSAAVTHPLAAPGLPAVFGEFELRQGTEWVTIRNRSILAGEIVRLPRAAAEED
ncbi:M23 family metallopeptidase [Planctomycetota bacterium]